MVVVPSPCPAAAVPRASARFVARLTNGIRSIAEAQHQSPSSRHQRSKFHVCACVFARRGGAGRKPFYSCRCQKHIVGEKRGCQNPHTDRQGRGIFPTRGSILLMSPSHPFFPSEFVAGQ